MASITVRVWIGIIIAKLQWISQRWGGHALMMIVTSVRQSAGFEKILQKSADVMASAKDFY